MFTKKELIKQAIQACGPGFQMRTVAAYLLNRGLSVSPVYIYSVKREMDGMLPYDQRNLIFTTDGQARTKTQIAEQILDDNPEMTGDGLHERLLGMGIQANIRHIKRLVAKRHNAKERQPEDSSRAAVLSLAQHVGGLEMLESLISSLRGNDGHAKAG